MKEVAASILYWLWQNKEWVFSGIGVAIFLFMRSLFFRKRPDHRRSQRQVGSRNQQAGGNIINVFPASSRQEPEQSAPSKDGKSTQDPPAAEATARPADPAQLAADRRSFEALQAIINSDWIVAWVEWQTTK